MFRKKVFLEISQNSQGNTCARISILIKLQGACNVIEKETQVQVFSCEFCEISENTFSYRTPLEAASAVTKLWLRKSDNRILWSEITLKLTDKSL